MPVVAVSVFHLAVPFRALNSLTGEIRNFCTKPARDEAEIDRDTINAIAPELAHEVYDECRASPLVAPTIAATLRQAVTVPALHNALLRFSTDPKLRGVTITARQARDYFPVFPILQKYLHEAAVMKTLQAGQDTSTYFDEILADRLQLGPVPAGYLPSLARLPLPLYNATRAMLDQKRDNLIGRTVIAYLHRAGVNARLLGIDPRSRLGAAYRPTRDMLGQLQGFSDDIPHASLAASVPVQPLLRAMIWLAQNANLKLAAPRLYAARALEPRKALRLMNMLVGLGAADHRTRAVKILVDPKDLEPVLKLGRLANVMDIVVLERNGTAGGSALRDFARSTFPPQMRHAAWKNQSRYLVNARHDFAENRQAVAVTLYAAAMRQMRDARDEPDRARITMHMQALQQTAMHALHAPDEHALTQILSQPDAPITMLTQSWQNTYSSHKRTYALRALLEVTGTKTRVPIQVPMIFDAQAIQTAHAERGAFDPSKPIGSDD